MNIILNAKINQDNVVNLSWQISTGEEVVYNIYRREKGMKVFSHIASVSEETYLDSDKKDFLAPSKPKILSSYFTGTDRVFISVISYDSEISYEYMIKVSDGEKEYKSNICEVVINTGIKEYKYLTVPAESDQDEIVHDGNFSTSASNSITTDKLIPGYNAFVVKSVDLSGNESDEQVTFIYVETGEKQEVKPSVGIGVPTGVRYNNRYRGPQESKKTDFMYKQVRFNINKMRKKLEELEILKDRITSKPNYRVDVITESIDDINKMVKEIRKW